MNTDKIPESWVQATIGEVCSNPQYGYTTKASKFGNLRLLRTTDITCKRINWETVPYCSKNPESVDAYLLEDGDIVVSRTGSVGISHLVKKPLKAVFASYLIRLKPLINNRFLAYFLESPVYWAAIADKKLGIAVPNINATKLKSIPLPIPPDNEQCRIVTKIEKLFSELDKGIESLEKAREQLKVYRQAVLKHAFEGKLTERWREENKDKLEEPNKLLARIKYEIEARYKQQIKEWKIAVRKWKNAGEQGKKPKSPLKPKVLNPLSCTNLANLPSLPLGWLWVRLGSISLVGTGVTPLKSNLTYYSDGEVPWVTSGMLNESYVHHCSNYVTDKALNDTNLRLYPPHTLVVALYGEGKTRGKCSELLIHATTNQAVAAIIQEGSASSLRGFLKWFLTHNYEVMRLKSSGGVQPNLNLGIIENTAVPLCSITEAKEIERRIERQLSTLAYIETVIDSEIQKSVILRQSVLKQAFSGQLVAQQQSDESASVLLARIRAAINVGKQRT